MKRGNIMTKMKNSFYGIMTAMMMLVVSVFSQFDIQALIEKATGWAPPKWVCVIILGLGSVAAIIEVVAACGVTLPKWVAIACAGAMSVGA